MYNDVTAAQSSTENSVDLTALADEKYALFETLKNHKYAEMHARFREVRKYYNLEHQVDTPEGFEQYIPPTPRNLVESISSAIAPESYTIIVKPQTDSKDNVAQADKLQFGHTFNLDMVEAKYNYSPLYESFKATTLYGMSALKGAFWNPQEWGYKVLRDLFPPDEMGQKVYERALRDRKMRKLMRSPFEVDVVDPLNLFPDPMLFNGRAPQYVFESYKKTLHDVKSMYPKFSYPSKSVSPLRSLFGGRPSAKLMQDEVEWTEYWDKFMHIYWCDGNVVDIDQNALGFLPYEFCFSMLGKNSPSSKPEERAVGVLWPILDTIGAEAQFMTMLNVAVQLYAVPALRASKSVENENLSLGAADVNYLDDDQLVTQLFNVAPEAGQTLFAAIDSTKGMIESSAYGEALSGKKLPGVQSGIYEQLILSQAKKRFSKMIQSLETAWAGVLSKAMDVMDNLIEETPFENEKFKRSDINGYYLCKVNFKTADDFEKKSNIDNWNALRAEISLETRQALYPIGTLPKDESMRKLKEDIMHSETMKQGIAGLILQKMQGNAQQGNQTGARYAFKTPPKPLQAPTPPSVNQAAPVV
ncbi:hypothetical protein KKA53_04975 [Candidatus Dependentiae bacterium]|nr:hypothetical protein [Candidatus Dependentiae bacterium]